MPTDNFWTNKRVLITGNTGFKGSWLTIWLNSLGAKVSGLSLPRDESSSLFWDAELQDICTTSFGDIREINFVKKVIELSEPEIIFHFAAQSLVREGYSHPLETIQTNSMGTVNLLEVLRELKNPMTVIVVTTDKVYEDKHAQLPYKEADRLGGIDPYSASKSVCEIFVECYKKSYFVDSEIRIATARAGNVIGGGDWAKDRLIPDAIRSWGEGLPIKIRYPTAVRPWQHVLEPLYGYMKLAENLYFNKSFEKAYNFGPNIEGCSSVKDILTKAWALYSSNNKKKSFVEYEEPSQHESECLMLNVDLAKNDLGYTSRLSLEQALNLTISWYLKSLKGHSKLKLCLEDINLFESTGSNV